MLGDKVWLAVPVHSNGVGWDWGQGPVQASQDLCAQGNCTVILAQNKHLPQNVATKLEETAL